MRTRFRPDHQLTARMLVTMFLLGLVYVAFIVTLIVLIKSVVVVRKPSGSRRPAIPPVSLPVPWPRRCPDPGERAPRERR